MCRDWRARQGATTEWASAHKAERVAWSLASPSECSMARQARCNRVHSAVTYQVNVIEEGKVNVHAALLKFASGQLPFLGSVHMSTAVQRQVGQVAIHDAGRRCHRMHGAVIRIQDMHHLDAAHTQRIRDHRAVTAPPDCLGAHQRGT